MKGNLPYDTLPKYIDDFNNDLRFETYRDSLWTKILPDSLYLKHSRLDNFTGEVDSYHMDHDLELLIPDPGNIWKHDFYIFSYPGNVGGGRAAPLVRFSWLGLFLEHCSWNLWISSKYWKYVFVLYFCVFY